MELWISLAALVIAALSWLDSIRRIRRDEIAFQIEKRPRDDEYAIRNTGKRRVDWPQIDGDSVTGFELEGVTMTPRLAPGQSMPFRIRRNSLGALPDSITVKFGRGSSRVIPMPSSSSDDEPTAS